MSPSDTYSAVTILAQTKQARAARQIYTDLAASGQEWDAATLVTSDNSILVLSVWSNQGGDEKFHLGYMIPGQSEISPGDLATVSRYSLVPAWAEEFPNGWMLSAAPDYAPSPSYLISGDPTSMSSINCSELATIGSYGDSLIVNANGKEKRLVFDAEGTSRAKFLNRQARLEQKLQDAVDKGNPNNAENSTLTWWDQMNQHQDEWVFEDHGTQAEIEARLETCRKIWDAFPKKARSPGCSRPWSELSGFPPGWPCQMRDSTWSEYVIGRSGQPDEERLRYTYYATIALTTMLLRKHGSAHLTRLQRKGLADLLAQACRSGRLYMKDHYHRIHPMSDAGLYSWTARLCE